MTARPATFPFLVLATSEMTISGGRSTPRCRRRVDALLHPADGDPPIDCTTAPGTCVVELALGFSSSPDRFARTPISFGSTPTTTTTTTSTTTTSTTSTTATVGSTTTTGRPLATLPPARPFVRVPTYAG